MNAKILKATVIAGVASTTLSLGTLHSYAAEVVSDVSTEEVNQNQKAVIINLKQQGRNHLNIVAAGGKAAGFPIAAELLTHSLQDNPSTKTYGTTTSMATKLANTTEHKNALATIKNKLKTFTGTSYTHRGSYAVSSNTDLYLALNKVSYVAECTKKGNTWTINFTYTDTYDFELSAWKKYGSSLKSTAVTAMNNYAALGQSVGAVVPYKVTIKISATY